MDTIIKTQDKAREPDGPGDYYMVIAEYGTYFVSGATAARIGRVLERWFRPRWLKFADVNGSRVWVRTRAVHAVTESTLTQRTRDREFDYLRRREERAERRWDDDDLY